MQGIPLTIDHVVPLGLGGQDDIRNIQPLCGPCNAAKNDSPGLRCADYRTPEILRFEHLSWSEQVRCIVSNGPVRFSSGPGWEWTIA